MKSRRCRLRCNREFSRFCKRSDLSGPGDAKPVEVDVRILAASSDKMDRALAEKRMHADLYYRLSAFTVHVPALRHRKDEIGILLRYSMHKLAKYYGLPPRDFTPATLEACQNHSWPGNLKELETFVKRYLIAGDEELPGESTGSSAMDADGRTASPVTSTRVEKLKREQNAHPEIAEIDDSERPVGNRKKRNRSGPGEDRMESEGGSAFVGCKLSDDSVQD